MLDEKFVRMHLKNLRDNFDACDDQVALEGLLERINDLEWVLGIDEEGC